MSPVSAVIITFNEEKNILRCIQSLQPVADEILVVDSYSTDKTQEICRSMEKVKVIEHTFEGHIQQKNWAMKQATYDYVLSLDADEALDEHLQQSIINTKKNLNYTAYSLNRLTNYCGQWIYHSGWYPDQKLRLWNRHKGKWQGINPHDEWIPHQPEPIGYLEGHLLHYSYHSINDHIKQVNYFTDIAAEAYAQKQISAHFGKLLFHPFWKFLKAYFIKRGFLDGFYGWVICIISAHATFLKYVKLRQLYQDA